MVVTPLQLLTSMVNEEDIEITKDIVQVTLSNGEIPASMKIDYKIKKQITWLTDDLILIVKHGYKLIATINDPNNNKYARVTITDPQGLVTCICRYKKRFKPRYMQFENIAHIHIEACTINKQYDYKIPDTIYDPYFIDQWLYVNDKITKRQLEKLIKRRQELEKEANNKI